MNRLNKISCKTIVWHDDTMRYISNNITELCISIRARLLWMIGDDTVNKNADIVEISWLPSVIGPDSVFILAQLKVHWLYY